VGGCSTGMHHALGNPLMVEVGDLFPQIEIFQQCWPARTGLQPVLVVGYLKALVASHGLAGLDGV
jgi:hypothetical protein